jgi:hypothetical protein
VVVEDVDFDSGLADQLSQFSDAADVARIHQHKASDLLEVDGLDVGHIEEITHAADEEISQVFFLRPRKYDASLGIQLLGGQKRGQGVEIRIDMGRNDRVRGSMVGLGQYVVQGLASSLPKAIPHCQNRQPTIIRS